MTWLCFLSIFSHPLCDAPHRIAGVETKDVLVQVLHSAIHLWIGPIQSDGWHPLTLSMYLRAAFISVAFPRPQWRDWRASGPLHAYRRLENSCCHTASRGLSSWLSWVIGNLCLLSRIRIRISFISPVWAAKQGISLRFAFAPFWVSWILLNS